MTSALPAAARPPIWPMYRAMVGVGVLCGAAIVTVFQLTGPVIARKQAAALAEAVFQVLPDATSSLPYRLGAAGFEPARDQVAAEPIVHAGYDATGALVGIAVEASGAGYQDRIRLLYGYSIAQEAIVGLRIMESRETPGLGDRIETDADFLDSFVRLDVSLTPDQSRVAHPIEYVPPGTRDRPWEVDGISGATISSTAVVTILRDSTAVWIPLLHRDLTAFQVGAEDRGE